MFNNSFTKVPQHVHLGRTVSGLPGFFTFNTLALQLSETQYQVFLADTEQAKTWASRFGFELFKKAA